MKVTVHVVLDVVPGTMKTEAEIKSDVSRAVLDAAYQFGAGYGPEAYTVRSVAVS